MKSFKSPENKFFRDRDMRRKASSEETTFSAKNYLSRRSSEPSSSSSVKFNKSIFSTNNNDSLLQKYLNITETNNKRASSRSKNTSGEMGLCTNGGAANSVQGNLKRHILSQSTNSMKRCDISGSSSGSYITKFANKRLVGVSINSNDSYNGSWHGWASDASAPPMTHPFLSVALPAKDDTVSFSNKHLEGKQSGNIKKNTIHDWGEKENLDNDIIFKSKDDDLVNTKVDTSILPDPDSDEEEMDFNSPSPLRSNAQERSPSSFLNQFPLHDFEKFEINCHKALIPSILDDNTTESDSSDLCPPRCRPSLSSIQKFTDRFTKVPIPNYESDSDSISEDSPLIMKTKKSENIENRWSKSQGLNIDNEATSFQRADTFISKFVAKQNIQSENSAFRPTQSYKGPQSRKSSSVKREKNGHPERASKGSLNAKSGSDHVKESLVQPVVKMKDSSFLIPPALKSVSNLKNKFEDVMFKPISRASETPLVRHEAKNESSLRATRDTSSRMELEQILHQSKVSKVQNRELKVVKTGDTVKTSNQVMVQKPVKRSQTPLWGVGCQKYIEQAAKLVPKDPKNKSLVKMFNNNFKSLDSSVTLVEETESSSSISTPRNKSSGHNSKTNLSRNTVVPSSDENNSPSSSFSSLKGSDKNNKSFNFTRLINTDANNNTLVGKQSFKRDSPAILPIDKPTKTYTRKISNMPRHKWFSTQVTNNNIGKIKKSSYISAIKKKKLFHLPTSYRESWSSVDSLRDKKSNLFKKYVVDNNNCNNIFKSKLKESSHSLFNISELDEDSGDECYTTEKSTKKTSNWKDDEGLFSHNLRRSSRLNKRVNYKEHSDVETDKSVALSECSKNLLSAETKTTEAPYEEKILVKQMILKNSNKGFNKDTINDENSRNKIAMEESKNVTVENRVDSLKPSDDKVPSAVPEPQSISTKSVKKTANKGRNKGNTVPNMKKSKPPDVFDFDEMDVVDTVSSRKRVMKDIQIKKPRKDSISAEIAPLNSSIINKDNTKNERVIIPIINKTKIVSLPDSDITIIEDVSNTNSKKRTGVQEVNVHLKKVKKPSVESRLNRIETHEPNQTVLTEDASLDRSLCLKIGQTEALVHFPNDYEPPNVEKKSLTIAKAPAEVICPSEVRQILDTILRNSSKIDYTVLKPLPIDEYLDKVKSLIDLAKINTESISSDAIEFVKKIETNQKEQLNLLQTLKGILLKKSDSLLCVQKNHLKT